MRQRGTQGRCCECRGIRRQVASGQHHMRFRGAVLVIQCRAIRGGTPGTQIRAGLQSLPGLDQNTHAWLSAAGVLAGERVQHHVRGKQHINTLGIQEACQRRHVLTLLLGNHHKGMSSSHGGKKLLHGYVKLVRRIVRQRRPRRDDSGGGLPVDQVLHHLPRHHHAFGDTSGSRGVNDVRGVVTCQPPGAVGGREASGCRVGGG